MKKFVSVKDFDRGKIDSSMPLDVAEVIAELYQFPTTATVLIGRTHFKNIIP